MLHCCYIPTLYQLVASPRITLKPEWGGLSVKCFSFLYFSLQRRVKDVFFLNLRLQYTGVPLHICKDVNRKMTRGGTMDAKR